MYPNRRPKPKPKPKIPPLDHKFKPNPKYEKVQAVLETGSNTRKQMERLEELKNFYKFRPDEIFRRISSTSLVTLILEVLKLEYQEDEIEENSIRVEASESLSDEASPSEEDLSKEVADDDTAASVIHRNKTGDRLSRMSMRSSHRSSVIDLIQGIGELDTFNDEASESSGDDPERDRPYLLLDVRDAEDFASNGHVITAKSYPHSRLTRSVNYETKDMLHFKNREGKLIVLCDQDESLASKCATTLVQRGYDNVYMLSGGLRVAIIKFPVRLITYSDDRPSEEDIMMLEDHLEEAVARGTSRLSQYGCSSRMSRAPSTRGWQG